MLEWVGKKVYIGIQKNKTILHFTATINSVTEKHISFTDKYGKSYCFLRDEVYEIYEKDEEMGWKYNDEN